MLTDCLGPLDLIGNDACNDEVNNAWCNFDNGDCCGACINTENCSQCLCHQDSASEIDLSCKQHFIHPLLDRSCNFGIRL